jgi:hypothetical protein
MVYPLYGKHFLYKIENEKKKKIIIIPELKIFFALSIVFFFK